MLSPNNNKLEIKPFFVKSPGVNYKENVWNNFTIDLYSFMEAFKGISLYLSLNIIGINIKLYK